MNILLQVIGLVGFFASLVMAAREIAKLSDTRAALYVMFTGALLMGGVNVGLVIIVNAIVAAGMMAAAERRAHLDKSS